MKLKLDVSQAIAYAGRLAAAATKVRPEKVTKHYGTILLARTKAYASGRPGPNAPTGTYRSSIRIRYETDMATGTSAAIVGSEAPQAARLEFGFKGVDSLGRHYCADEATEVLTPDGWTNHADLAPGDTVLALDTATGLMVWDEVSAVNRFPGVHDVTRIEGRTLSAVVTADHRWWVERYYARGRQWIAEWRTTADLKANCRIPLTQKSGQTPVVATVPDDVVELVGWFWTEGAYGWSRQVADGERVPTSRPIGLSISQSPRVNPAKCERIEALLIRLFGAPGPFAQGAHWNIRHNDVTGVNVYNMDRVACWLVERAVRPPTKALEPRWLASLTQAQLELLIDVSMLADGHVDGAGVRKLSQANEDRIRSFEVACALAGQPTVTRYRYNRAKGRGERWETSLLRTAHSHAVGSALRSDRDDGALFAAERYEGVVWCPTTATGTWLARRNGTVYVTGNSQPPFPHYSRALADMERIYPASVERVGMEWVPLP